MSNSPNLTVELDDESLADLDRLAAHFECTRERLVATAVYRFLAEEERRLPRDPDDPLASPPAYVETDPLAAALDQAENEAVDALHAYPRPAEDDIEAGRLINHDDFMHEMRERYRSRDAA